MAQPVKYRSILREIALDQYGYVTTSDAIEAGVPVGEFPKLAARGGIESISYGLYRFSDIPIAHLDQFAEALLRVGPSAFLYRETVLSIFGLAHVNPESFRLELRVAFDVPFQNSSNW